MPPRSTRFAIVALCAALGDAFALTAFAAPAAAATPFATALTRAPYLTDLVGTHVDVNFATDRSGSAATVAWGSATGGTCSPTTVVTAVGTSVTVGAVNEYSWYAPIDLPASGSYCYRAYLGSVDLLGSAASPVFTTQVPRGAPDSFTFDVIGDWGQVDSTGANPAMASLMSRIANSGARFMVTVGDNGYPNGSQINYGDLQQTGADTSAIFGPSFWTVAGSTTPIFTAAGNHGCPGRRTPTSRPGAQDQAVSQSNGRYQNDVYCCVNGTTSANYASEWYAFDAGNARFYILDSAWGDTNKGNADVYANDAAAHFAPGTPEYQWLLNDLATHPSQLKFAFFHYPLYTDNKDQASTRTWRAPTRSKACSRNNGVQTGVQRARAHLRAQHPVRAWDADHVRHRRWRRDARADRPVQRQRRVRHRLVADQAEGLLVRRGPRADQRCAALSLPARDGLRLDGDGCADRLHAGPSSTRRPTRFTGAPVTYLDSRPAALTTATSATFTFHASDPAATYTCTLDSQPPTACTSPATVSGLVDGAHSFTVVASANGRSDPSPPTARWTVDTTAPSKPLGLTGSGGQLGRGRPHVASRAGRDRR